MTIVNFKGIIARNLDESNNIFYLALGFYDFFYSFEYKRNIQISALKLEHNINRNRSIHVHIIINL